MSLWLQASNPILFLLLLKAAGAMALWKRRRTSVFPLPFGVVALAVTLVAFAVLSFAVWRSWPVLSKQIQAIRLKSFASKKDSAAGETVKKTARPTASPSAETADLMKKEIEALREENQKIRDQLQSTSEAVARKQSEIDELKLQLLIRDKTRAAKP